jgi:hypothetical protein
MWITERDVRQVTPLDSAGVLGGIHRKRTYLVVCKDGSKWIWKHGTGEERKELFVYELAKLYFREIVPEVQILCLEQNDLGCGSAIRKVSGVPVKDIVNPHGYFYGNPDVLLDLAAMIVLDYLLGNPDRHPKNWLLMHNGRIAAIDNGWAGKKAITIADALKPAVYAKIDQDPDLWPHLLYYILYLTKNLEESGLRTARSLARKIGVQLDLLEDWPDRVQKIRTWAFEELRRALGDGSLEKALPENRVYVHSPEEAPPGVQLYTGPKGGIYYLPSHAAPENPDIEELLDVRRNKSGKLFFSVMSREGSLHRKDDYWNADRVKWFFSRLSGGYDEMMGDWVYRDPISGLSVRADSLLEEDTISDCLQTIQNIFMEDPVLFRDFLLVTDELVLTPETMESGITGGPVLGTFDFRSRKMTLYGIGSIDDPTQDPYFHYLMAHEVGHGVDRYLASRQDILPIKDWYDYIKVNQSSVEKRINQGESSDELLEAANKYLPPSSYGTSNFVEFIAECYAFWHLGKLPRVHATYQMFEQYDSALQEAGREIDRRSKRSRKIRRSIHKDLPPERVYVDSPEEAPPGVQLYTGPRGGLYYVPEESQIGSQPPDQRDFLSLMSTLRTTTTKPLTLIDPQSGFSFVFQPGLEAYAPYLLRKLSRAFQYYPRGGVLKDLMISTSSIRFRSEDHPDTNDEVIVEGTYTYKDNRIDLWSVEELWLAEGSDDEHLLSRQKSVLSHEVGHGVMGQILTNATKEEIESYGLMKFADIWNEYVRRKQTYGKEDPVTKYYSPPTEYGGSNIEEYFAECYSFWRMDLKRQLNEHMANYFENNLQRYLDEVVYPNPTRFRPSPKRGRKWPWKFW